jgi:hypothetical protein
LKKWLYLAARLLVVVLVIGFVGTRFFQAWGEWNKRKSESQQSVLFEIRPAWLALAGGVYILGLLPAGVFWHRLLLTLGQEPRWGETLRAYYIGHLGKYVPGKAMVVILRTALIRSHCVDTTVAALSVFLESLTWIAVGSFMAAAYLAVQFRDKYLLMWGMICLMLAVGVPTLPPVFRLLVRLVRAEKYSPEVGEKLLRLGYGTILWGWIIMPISWIMLGISYWATLRGLGIAGLDFWGELPRYSASVALATVGGFVVLPVPGGLGTRELLLAEVTKRYLGTLLPSGDLMAWTAAFLLRMVWLVSEVAISVILYIAGLRKPAPPP